LLNQQFAIRVMAALDPDEQWFNVMVIRVVNECTIIDGRSTVNRKASDVFGIVSRVEEAINEIHLIGH
jgi:hypothetical protein